MKGAWRNRKRTRLRIWGLQVRALLRSPFGLFDTHTPSHRQKSASTGTRTRISTLEGWNSALRPWMLLHMTFLNLTSFFPPFFFSPFLTFSFIYSLHSIFSEDPIVQMVGHLPYYHSDSRKSLLLRLIDWWEDAGSTPAGIFFFLSLSLPFLPFLIKIPLSPMTWRGEYSSVGRA